MIRQHSFTVLCSRAEAQMRSGNTHTDIMRTIVCVMPAPLSCRFGGLRRPKTSQTPRLLLCTVASAGKIPFTPQQHGRIAECDEEGEG